jgi:hypothetical protein
MYWEIAFSFCCFILFFISDIQIFRLFPPRKVHLEVQTVEVFKSLKAEHNKIGFIDLTFFSEKNNTDRFSNAPIILLETQIRFFCKTPIKELIFNANKLLNYYSEYWKQNYYYSFFNNQRKIFHRYSSSWLKTFPEMCATTQRWRKRSSKMKVFVGWQEYKTKGIKKSSIG